MRRYYELGQHHLRYQGQASADYQISNSKIPVNPASNTVKPIFARQYWEEHCLESRAEKGNNVGAERLLLGSRRTLKHMLKRRARRAGEGYKLVEAPV